MSCEYSYLWNDGESRPERRQTQVGDVDAIYVDGPARALNYSEERQR